LIGFPARGRSPAGCRIKSGMTVGEQRAQRPDPPQPSRKRARAKNLRRGVGKISPEGRTRAVPLAMKWSGDAGSLPLPHRGGAERARPGTRRMLSGIRQAAPCRPRSRPFACPSSGPSARIAPAAVRTDRGTCVWRGFRHGPWRAVSGPSCPPQARPGDTPLARLSAGAEQDPGPVAGFPPARLGTCPAKPVLPAEPRWPPPPEACRATSAHPAPGIPSRLHRNVRDPSGSGSAGDYGMGVEGVEKGWRVIRPIWPASFCLNEPNLRHYQRYDCIYPVFR